MTTNNDQGKGDEFWALLQTDEAKQAVETAERGGVTVGVNLRTGEPVQHDPLAVVVEEEAWTTAPAPETERAVDELARRARGDVH